MLLHLNAEEFKDLIQATAQDLEIPDVFVEKDYWVTKILLNIAKSDFKDQVVFKGGTSLSKAYDLISRFSEDVDIALLCEPELTDARRKKLLKKIEKAATCGFTEANDQAVESGRENESKGSKYRKTWWAYERLSLEGEYGQAHPYLLFEINSFSDPNPYSSMKLQSFIGKFLEDNEQSQVITEYELESFEINVLSTKRTMAEKIMGLIQACHKCSEDDYSKLAQKIRHIYDIHHMVMKDKEVQKWLDTDDFFSIISAVHENDKSVHNKSADWCHEPLAQSKIFSSFDKVWPHIETTWEGDFRVLVHEEQLPAQSALNSCFAQIRDRLSEYDQWLQKKSA